MSFFKIGLKAFIKMNTFLFKVYFDTTLPIYSEHKQTLSWHKLTNPPEEVKITEIDFFSFLLMYWFFVHSNPSLINPVELKSRFSY